MLRRDRDRLRCGAIMALGLGIAEAMTSSPTAPVEVYVGSHTVAAAPYWQAVSRSAQRPQVGARASPRDGVRPLSAQLPLRPQVLQPGPAQTRAVPGLTTPFFVMGMDPHSLHWLAEHAALLQTLQAQGRVVEAPRREDWENLQRAARAAGVGLVLSRDTALATLYDIRSYPVLFLPPNRAEEGIHESSH